MTGLFNNDLLLSRDEEEILKCDHSNESYPAVSSGVVYALRNLILISESVVEILMSDTLSRCSLISIEI